MRHRYPIMKPSSLPRWTALSHFNYGKSSFLSFSKYMSHFLFDMPSWARRSGTKSARLSCLLNARSFCLTRIKVEHGAEAVMLFWGSSALKAHPFPSRKVLQRDQRICRIYLQSRQVDPRPAAESHNSRVHILIAPASYTDTGVVHLLHRSTRDQR